MTLIFLIYLAANQGVLVAQPVVINALALGVTLESVSSYKDGLNSSVKEPQFTEVIAGNSK